MAETVIKLTVADHGREQARKGANFLERAAVLEHGGLFLTKANGEHVMAEMPASLLRTLQRVFGNCR